MDKQSMPATGISLERATDRTPEPTQFYLFQHDTLIASFATKRKAEQAYHAAIAASGYQPAVVEPTNPDGLGTVEARRRTTRPTVQPALATVHSHIPSIPRMVKYRPNTNALRR